MPRDGPTPGRTPADDDRIEAVAIGGSPGADRRILAVAVAIVAIVIVAIVKPWASSDAPEPPATPGTSLSAPVAVGSGPPAAPPSRASASAVPSAGPGNRDPGGQCELGEEWRVFTLEVDAGLAVSSWRPVAPVVAEGPDDVTIPTVRVVADRVYALGFCARVDAGARRPITLVEAWARSAAGRLEPVYLAPLAGWTPPDPDAGRVFLRSDGHAPVGGGWAPGDYVFVVRHGPAAADADWYAVRIVAESGGSATFAPPRASPAATMPGPAVPSGAPAPSILPAP